MTAFLLAVSILALGGFAALLAGRHRSAASLFGAGSAVIGALLGLAGAAEGLIGSAPLTLVYPWPVPGGSFAVMIDGLSAFFLVPIFLLTLACAVFGSEYMRSADVRLPGSHWLLFNLLAAAMALVVTAANGVLFLAAWEIMSLTSFFLVAFDHRLQEVRSAAWLYLMATHLGTAFLFALFLLAGRETGSLDFSSFTALSGLSAGSASLLFVLALVGFGAKAGIFPLHIWLPDAHPAAPSHVSALMSGVMIKTGIYGILRLVAFLPPAPPWWGSILMGLGILGALFGISMAAVQRDIKRCLAYSTVENVGIIFLALGLGIFANGRGMPEVALLAWVGGLLHLWNHALFKGLMFLGAGSLVHATATRDMNRLGGILKRMPATGSLMIGGSLAIAALPPLNGFVGEWLIYLGLLQAGQDFTGLIGVFPLFLAGLLALTGGLVLIVFTRLVGISLLGESRSPEAAGAHEAGWRMIAPMGLLLAICLGVGFFPFAVLPLLATPIALISGHAGAQSVAGATDVLLPVGWAAAVLAVLLLFCGGIFVWLRRVRTSAVAPTWGCGFSRPTPRMAYTAGGFAELAQNSLLPRSMRPLVAAGSPEGPFPVGGRFEQRAPDPVFHKVFLPFFLDIADRCVRLRWLQQGRLHVYLLYVFLTCAILLAWGIWSAGRWP